jgi:hypothetical protein
MVASTVPRSLVPLPPHVDGPFQVFVNGVLQTPDTDFHVEGRTLVFDKALRKDKISGWRWFLGAWGVGTYRQDDSIDVRYEVDGRPKLAEGLTIASVEDDEDDAG